jgi:hypothetical protein
MKTDLTDKQRQALEHVERARSAGMRLSDYARAHGVGIRSIYDSMVALRKKGLLTKPMTRGESAFVAVRVKPLVQTMPVSGFAWRSDLPASHRWRADRVCAVATGAVGHGAGDWAVECCALTARGLSACICTVHRWT